MERAHGYPNSVTPRGLVESRMRWKPHVRFGGRAGETDQPKDWHRAPVRSHLANAALDEVRRRTQQATTGHRGRKADPLYRIRRRLLASHDRLDPMGFARMLTWLDAGDPQGEVGAAYLAKELLRDTYIARNALEARRRLVAFYDYCTASGVPELERLARTIARWQTPILRWHHTRLTNAATEGTNLIIKNIKRLGFGFRNFENYRLRLLLRCGAPWQHRPVASIRPRQPRVSA